MRRKKNAKHRKAKRTNSQENWDDFRKLRNEYNSKIADSKKKAENAQLESLRNPEKLSQKKWWHVAKTVLKRNTVSSYPPIHIGDSIITDNQEKANQFNEHFSSFSTLDFNNTTLPPEQDDPPNIFNNIVLTQKEVSDLIKCIKTNKASGPDLVTPTMLKQAGDSIVPSLTKLFNMSLSTHTSPHSWKKANIVPIFKKDDNTLINNYRLVLPT